MASFHTLEVSDPAFCPPGVTHITVKSVALRRRADLTCYRPPSAPAGAVLPLVILLHGVYGSHWAWLGKGGAGQVLERLVAEGLPSMVLAMPSDGLFGDGSGYVKHADADYAAWVVNEVPLAVADAGVNGAEGPRFITGLSMGGFGALRLGALHPDKFTAFSGMSSVTAFQNMERFVASSGHVYEVTDPGPLSLLETLIQQRSSLRPFRFDCGTEDFLLAENRALNEGLTQARIPHEYAEHPGGHEWPYWQRHLADQLRFFADYL